MKYILEYNGHNPYLFDRIDSEYFFDSSSRVVPIPKSHIKIIEELRYTDRSITTSDSIMNLYSTNYVRKDVKCLSIDIIENRLGIMGNEKLSVQTFYIDDDWYMVEVVSYSWKGSWRKNDMDEEEYYMCDGIEGLLKFIYDVANVWM